MNIVNQNFGTVNSGINNYIGISACAKTNTNTNKRKQEREMTDNKKQENNDKTFDAILANKKQEEYCEENNLPHFAPKDGRCYKCGKNIYSVDGISIESAGKHLITGCPFCHYSYCE